MTKNNKLYPVTGYDAHGIKFFFDAEFPEKCKKHFTVRFAGNPMLVLEYLYIHRGGADFFKTYETVKAGGKCEGADLLKKCAKDVAEFTDALALMADNQKSPFVIYVNDYSENR